jgi:hypothetical protein
MKYKQFGKKVILRIDRGEELIQTLKDICKQLDIKLGTIMGIGATDYATIGLYDTNTKKYHSTTLKGDHEIAPLTGTITTMNDNLYLHLHVNLCTPTHQSYGGHLSKAIISATFEGVIDIIPGRVNRKKDNTLGLNLLEI